VFSFTCPNDVVFSFTCPNDVVYLLSYIVYSIVRHFNRLAKRW